MVLSLTEIYDLFQNSNGINTDTRVIKPGEIFLALKGDNFDGNLFVDQALKKKAAKVISSVPKYIKHPDVIYVDNTLKFLHELANFHRRHFDIPVIAITGTNGKTTTKELLCAILKEKYNVLCTSGNFNNHIGVPLMVLRLQKHHDLAVIEMGASGLGEISTLCNIAMPTHGLITGVGKAHIEGFKTFSNIIKTKLELYDYLNTHNGIFFFNNEIYEISSFIDENNKNVLRFNSNDFKSDNIKLISIENDFPFLKFKFYDKNNNLDRINSNLYGHYNFMNIVNAIKIADYFDVGIFSIKESLASYIPKNNRSEVIEINNGFIILDAYNANPTSMQKSINSFRNIKTNQPKYLVLGDMLELGDISSNEHMKIIKELLQSDFFEKVFFIGEEFLRAGKILKVNNPKINFYKNIKEAKKAFSHIKIENIMILIKGSRGIRAEEILDKTIKTMQI